jgi:type I restriction enzyme R subunit
MSPEERKTPEELAREDIDRKLAAAGWVVQDRKDLNLAAGPGVAVRELPTKAGPADYFLFLGNRIAGVVEAKRTGTTLSSVEPQTLEYARNAPLGLQIPIQPLPFRYESTGVETWFTNGLDPEPRARALFQFHRPEALLEWLELELTVRRSGGAAAGGSTLKGRMRAAPVLQTAGMWPAQIRAVENLERSICAGRRKALIQMATGAGKTFTAITAAYRLIRHGGARRVLFLVDRGNLGRQAHLEFQKYDAPDDGRKFTELYNVTNLTHNVIEPVNKVVVTTIQRLYSILKGEPSFAEEVEEGSTFEGRGAALLGQPSPVVYQPRIPPEFFDVIVVDECHRSIYTVWRQVLDYFDASIIGLTATPAKHTYGFFEGNVVSEYTHEQAVRDKVNVPFSVYEIRTKMTESGATLVADGDAHVGKRDRATRAVRWERLDEDLEYEARHLDRSVVAKDQIRLVLQTLRQHMLTEIFPGRKEIPKTLIYAKSDDHAEDVLRILRDTWGMSNEQAVKITYKPEQSEGAATPRGASHKPETMIQSFRNAYNPRVAITVDMIATGTDIKPLECVVFLRSVGSRTLFDQMKGRAVRVMPDADFRAVTPDAPGKTHFVIVDCVGVLEGVKADPPLDRERSIPFERLLEGVRAGNRDEGVITTLAARLDRMDRRLSEEQRRRIEQASGGVPLRDLVSGIIDRMDPEREDNHARRMFGLPPGAAPGPEQVQAAQVSLREEAVAPIAYAPALCQALLEVRKAQDVILDEISRDSLLRAGARPDLAPDYAADRAMVSAFEQFCGEHRDELEALIVLYQRPFARRLTRKALVELVEALRRPPRQWTTEALWAAYERLDKDRVRGNGRDRVMTDLIGLVRKAMGVQTEVAPFAEEAGARYAHWLRQQEGRGRRFTPEQREILELMRDRIVVDLELRLSDFDDTPFAARGGLGRVHRLFGDELPRLVEELNRELVA